MTSDMIKEAWRARKQAQKIAAEYANYNSQGRTASV